MSKLINPRGPSLARLGAMKVLTIAAMSAALTGCKALDNGTQVAGWSLVDPNQRHPIMVSQKPSHLSVHVPRGSNGLTPAQRAEVIEFSSKYRAADSGNSRLVISAPGGAPNEVAAMNAVQEIRDILLEGGFPESAIAVEAYNDESNHQPPIRISYMRFVAEGPECGYNWSENLARTPSNGNYQDFGCFNQHNLAAMVANPADLLGPRTEGPRNAERRDKVWDKYVKGETTGAQKSNEEKVRVGND